MNIYLIKRDKTKYDGFTAHIIVAKDEGEVRRLAKDVAEFEGKDTWDDATVTKEGIYTGSDLESFILLSDFLHG